MVQQRLHIIRKHKFKINDPEIWIFTKKEIIWILIFIIIGAFISFIPVIPNDDPEKILINILIFAIIIIVNLSAKKLISSFYSIKIEHNVWQFQRWGYYERSYFKKPVPIGLIMPFFLAILSLGYLKPFTFFQYNAENIKEKRLLKAHGDRRAVRKEVINEADLAYTSATGFYALILLALIGLSIKSFLNFDFGTDLAKYSIYYSIWNMIPFSQLDGTKLFFGATIAWIFVLIIQITLLLIIVF